MDLSEANLIGADLSGAALSVANFRRANLIGVDLSRANLNVADLSEAKLNGANLSRANLIEADLNGADLAGAYLTRANLIGANFNGTNLIGADLIGADLSGVNLNRAKRERSRDGLIQYLQRGVKTLFARKEEGQGQQRTEVASTLRIRIEEEPLTAPHMSEALDALISLYVKMWLLQQNRFDDFLRYTEKKDRRFEEEAHILIEELKYNSPADIRFNIDLSPKSLVEALQMLVDMITQRKQRQQAANLKILKEQINVLDQSVETAKHIVETIAPGLDAEQKGRAVQSVLEDLRRLAQDPTLEMSLTLSASVSQPQYKQIVEAKQPLAQPSEQTAP